MKPLSFKKGNFFLALILLLVVSFAHAADEASPKSTTVTNSFFETDIREVLRDISAQTGIKIVADDTVQGSISIELKNVPLQEALRMVLSIGNYTFREMPEGYYLVGLCTPNSPSFNRLSVTEYYHPNYLKAKELQSLVSDFYQPYIKINEEVNTLTITASPEIEKRIKEDLLKFDQAQRQVMLEALVIELTDEGKRLLGVNWGSMLDGGFSVYPPSAFEFAHIPGVKGSWNASGTLSTDLLAQIHTLIQDGKAKVRANPRVATLEGKQAEIFVGREEYFLINVGAAAQAYYTLQSIATGVVLKITPYVDKNNEITVTIAPQVSEVVGRGTTNLPVVTRRTASTSLRVNNGQTIAIGGLVQEQSNDIESKVPILGSVPFLGQAFRYKNTQTINKEVVIFITPRILNSNNEVPEKAAKNLIPVQNRERTESPDDSIKNYFSTISRIIESRKRYPNLLREGHYEGPVEVTVDFIVFPNGTVGEVELAQSSGVPLLDLITLKLIENLSPFPPFPKEITQPSIHFLVPVRYEP